MYDTVKFRLNCLEKEIRYLLSKFDSQRDTNVHDKCRFYQLDNLGINIYNSFITIEGSLAKFYYGNNLHLLGREEIKQVIDLLSDILQLDINSAHVTRIDIAADFEMSHNTKEYLPFFETIHGIREIYVRELHFIINPKVILLPFTTKGYQ